MLDIGVGNAAGKPPIPIEPILTLDDDGYYWFLHPLFEELRAATGQYIDLYGNATFTGANLDALDGILSAAQRLVELQPECWEVHIGTQVLPVQKEIYKPVKRTEFFRLLGLWEHVLERARQTGHPVVCFGD